LDFPSVSTGLTLYLVVISVSGVQSLSFSAQSTPEKNGHSDDASKSSELL